MTPDTEIEAVSKKRPEAPAATQDKKAPKKSKPKSAAGEGESDAKAAKTARAKKKDKKEKEPESLFDQNQDAVLPIPSVPIQAGRRIPAKRIEDILLFTLDANNYLHTIQAERGVSTCYVASKGQVLQKLIANVRKDTDEAAEKLKKCDICATAGTELLREGALRQFRKEVDFLESPFLQVLTGYNMLIDGLLEEIFKLVNPLHSIDIGMVLGCYNSFLYLKDMIGRMRATIGCILSDKSKKAELSVMGHLTLVANIGAQKAFTKAFISTGISSDIRTDFMNFCRECPAEVTLVERNLMISREAAWSTMARMTPEHWFQTMSQRLNALDKIQQKLTLNILEMARRYCAKRKEAAEEKRASRAAKAARDKAAAGATSEPPPAAALQMPSIVQRTPSMTGAVSSGRLSEDGVSEENDDIHAGERLLEVLTSIQDEDIDMNFEWANKLGDESTWLPQTAAPPAVPLMGLGGPPGAQHLSPLASFLAGGGGGSSMASIMPTPQNH